MNTYLVTTADGEFVVEAENYSLHRERQVAYFRPGGEVFYNVWSVKDKVQDDARKNRQASILNMLTDNIVGE